MKRTSFAGSFAFYLAFQGLLLRALLPAGTMPAHDGHGWRLAFCTSSGVQFSLDSKPPVTVHTEQCPFALALANAALAPQVSVSIPVVAFTCVLPAVPALAETSPAPYSARGPPVLV